MNIEKLLKNKTSNEIKEFNLKLNNQILLQLMMYAIEDKEIEFDNLIKREINLMTDFGFSPEVYDTNFENNKISVELSNVDYVSFLEASIDLLPSKYIKKVAENITKEQVDEFIKERLNHNQIQMIKLCISKNKKEAMNKILDLGIFTEKGVLQTIFLFERKNIKTFVEEDILINPIILHEAFDGISFKSHNCLLGEESNNNINLLKRGGFFYGKLISSKDIIEALETANINNYQYKNDVVKSIINALIIDLSTLPENIKIFNSKNDFDEYLIKKIKPPSSKVSVFNDFIFELIKKDFFDMDEELEIKLLNNDKINFKFSNWYDFNNEQKNIIIQKRTEIISKELKKREYVLKNKI